jgi:hypothetical protein
MIPPPPPLAGQSLMGTLNIEGDDFQPEWNYTITPRLKPNS